MNEKERTNSSKRLLSLDTLRGLTIVGMIIVNDPGSWNHIYPPLRHAEWHGMTPTDLVFPFFLFIVGVSVTLAYTKRMAGGATRKSLLPKIFRRTIILFALGLFLNVWPGFNFAEIRIPGVLQRIALVFFCCAFLFLYSDWRKQVLVGVGLLIGYWLMLIFIPVPGVGSPSLEPGQNIANWLDGQLIPGRLYQGTWDPEGLLSTLPSIATGITGMLVGELLLLQMSRERKLIWLFVAGFLAFLIGYGWGWIFPINKSLWTSSYVLVSSGLATLLFATCIWFVDELGYSRWTRLGIIFGANAITAYVLHGMLWAAMAIPLAGKGLQARFFDGLVAIGLPPNMVSFMYALLYTLICFLPIYWLYRKKIFIKI